MPIVTPVALLIFNRPDLTERVFAAIRQAKPKKLLVIADGPRFPDEQKKCEQARQVIQKVDWGCEVLTNFSDTNLGCKHRVSSGLDWVFSQVEEAIILEDDCLPAPSFFSFCETLLDYYRDDRRIMHISGDNFQDGQRRTKYSYYFSNYVIAWGWASWRRAWQYYDVTMKTWPEVKELRLLESLFPNHDEQQYWANIFEQVMQNRLDTWDYQWVYTCWMQNGLSVTPEHNLISNLGFRPDATHTVFEESPSARIAVQELSNIRHPPFVFCHKQADVYTFEHHYGGLALKHANTFYGKTKALYHKPRTLLSKLKKEFLHKPWGRR
jgi:hypothetical protein